MEAIKKNISLILGVSIPVAMILVVAGSIYLPGLFAQPKFNFLYAAGDDYYYGAMRYSIRNGRLMISEVKQPKKINYELRRGEVKLFVYDVLKNESREISFDEAQKLNLDPSSKSPDGFEVTHGSRDGGVFPFLFYQGGADYNTRYLVGHNVSKKLNIQAGEMYYYFRFLGWVKN